MWKISYVIMWKCESFTVSAATPWIRTIYSSVSKNRFLKKSVPQPCRFFVTSYTSAVSCTVYSTWWESVTARQLGRRRISENIEVKSFGHDVLWTPWTRFKQNGRKESAKIWSFSTDHQPHRSIDELWDLLITWSSCGATASTRSSGGTQKVHYSSGAEKTLGQDFGLRAVIILFHFPVFICLVLFMQW